MSDKQPTCSRRTFLKAAGAAGLGSLLAPAARAAAPADSPAANTVPTRPFGRTGETVSILSLGGMFDIPNNQLLLRQALNWGVSYWDTANSYGGGRSEKGIGKYFARYPQDRKKVFLVSKSGAWSVGGMTDDLQSSLERMQTDTIDLFFIHSVRRISAMDKDVKHWGETMKAAGKIRYFGFSTHSNMEECLLDAAKLGWIDAVMMTYNYRLMHTDDMRRAVDACTEAGIGLTAMKTQGGGQVRTESETEMKLAGRFLGKGYTDGQAKLKAVWENPRIASICSQMPNLNLLMTNVAAAVDRTRLGAGEKRLLQAVARETRSAYCAGCTRICESALAEPVPLGDVMRCLMYSRSYGEHERARRRFGEISAALRRRMAAVDYTPAEARCPQAIAIGERVREALELFS
jgi:predicted aldo/keto reductase-like oxidoreductase